MCYRDWQNNFYPSFYSIILPIIPTNLTHHSQANLYWQRNHLQGNTFVGVKMNVLTKKKPSSLLQVRVEPIKQWMLLPAGSIMLFQGSVQLKITLFPKFPPITLQQNLHTYYSKNYAKLHVSINSPSCTWIHVVVRRSENIPSWVLPVSQV